MSGSLYRFIMDSNGHNLNKNIVFYSNRILVDSLRDTEWDEYLWQVDRITYWGSGVYNELGKIINIE